MRNACGMYCAKFRCCSEKYTMAGSKSASSKANIMRRYSFGWNCTCCFHAAIFAETSPDTNSSGSAANSFPLPAARQSSACCKKNPRESRRSFSENLRSCRIAMPPIWRSNRNSLAGISSTVRRKKVLLLVVRSVICSNAIGFSSRSANREATGQVRLKARCTMPSKR